MVLRNHRSLPDIQECREGERTAKREDTPDVQVFRLEMTRRDAHAAEAAIDEMPYLISGLKIVLDETALVFGMGHINGQSGEIYAESLCRLLFRALDVVQKTEGDRLDRFAMTLRSAIRATETTLSEESADEAA